MSVSCSDYYKWKYRQEHPSIKMISRQSDIELITKIHNKMDIDGLTLMQDKNMVLFGLIIMFIYVVNMQILNIKASIINGKSLMKNMKHLII